MICFIDAIAAACSLIVHANLEIKSSATMDRHQEQRWFPLESNPSLMNQYIQRLGFDTSLYEFVDVFSTETWALDLIPQPVAAVIMLYPGRTQVQNDQEEGNTTATSTLESPQDTKCWFVKQRISNACGTFGLLHALLNAPEATRDACIDPKSWLGRYYADCPVLLSPTQKAERLENDKAIEKLHDKAASDSSNQTNRDCGNSNSNLPHFAALVHVDGTLYELDGRKSGPVRHGNTNEMNLLKDACRVAEKFMKSDPKEVRFTILALAPKL